MRHIVLVALAPIYLMIAAAALLQPQHAAATAKPILVLRTPPVAYGRCIPDHGGASDGWDMGIRGTRIRLSQCWEDI